MGMSGRNDTADMVNDPALHNASSSRELPLERGLRPTPRPPASPAGRFVPATATTRSARDAIGPWTLLRLLGEHESDLNARKIEQQSRCSLATHPQHPADTAAQAIKADGCEAGGGFLDMGGLRGSGESARIGRLAGPCQVGISARVPASAMRKDISQGISLTLLRRVV